MEQKNGSTQARHFGNTPRSSGSAATALILALLLVVLTLSTVYLFVARTWWFPPAITEFGHRVDEQFMRTLWMTGVVFVLSQLALAWAVVRFRARGQRATYSHGNNTMEAVWTIATAVVFVGVGFVGQKTWAALHLDGVQEGPYQVEVIGEQFKWSFRLPGPDGKFGRYKALEVVEKERERGRRSSPWDLDPEDPAGKDDIILPVGSNLAVPVNTRIQVFTMSKDVIHSFFVRELRVKQDAVPGLRVPIHFTPTVTGEYEVACAELCGQSHHQMRAFLLVKTPEEFQAWLKEQTGSD
jgi:cytochrome c oxidase subunit 2